VKKAPQWKQSQISTSSAQKDLKIYSKATIGVKADGTMALQSAGGSWNGGE
jgi:hypothetical protein